MGRKLCEASLEVERLGARVLFRRGPPLREERLPDHETEADATKGPCGHIPHGPARRERLGGWLGK